MGGEVFVEGCEGMAWMDCVFLFNAFVAQVVVAALEAFVTDTVNVLAIRI